MNPLLLLGLGVLGVALLSKKGGAGATAAASGPIRSSGSGRGMTFDIPGVTVFTGKGPWRDVNIGNSTAKIGKVGCLISCLATMANRMRGTSFDPLSVNEIGKRTPGAFNGANTNMTVLAPALGIEAPDRMRLRRSTGATIDQLRQRALDTVQKGGLPIFHVDYNRNVKQDFIGDHFIACVAVMTLPEYGVTFLCGDPATGTIRPIFAETMTGPGLSGTDYLVVSVAPVFPAGATPQTLA